MRGDTANTHRHASLHTDTDRAGTDRGQLLVRAQRLAVFTIVWNLLEGVVALTAGGIANSQALIGFGLDSAIESVSATVLLWRLRVERRQPHRAERVERTATKAIGVSFLLLAGYVAYDAIRALITAEPPGASTIGIAVAALSIVVMPILAHRKRVVGVGLASRATLADRAQTMACVWLSLVVLGGLVLNAALGWWWADPVAALGVVVLLIEEGRQTIAADHIDDCC